jgi:hypothetical protein
MIFCNSSPYSKVGKFYERYEVGMETDNGVPASYQNLSIQLPSWALFEGWWEDESFLNNMDAPKKCVTVSPDWDASKKNEDGSFFYTVEDRQAILSERNRERQEPEKYRVERRGKFAETVDAYLDPLMVDRMFEGVPSAFDAESGELLYRPLRSNRFNSHNEFRYKAHLDPSSTTAGFGFALAHVEEYMLNGDAKPHVVFDLIKRWDPKDFEDGVIAWEPILEELVDICDIFRPEVLTFDQHQSVYPIQWLRKTLRARGISTRVFEKTANIQGNWWRAETFRTALYQNLIHAPFDEADCKWASEELKYLQEIKTSRIPRVECQEVGPITTKDVADCVMEVVESHIGNLIAGQERQELSEMGLRVGAPGGYNFGVNVGERGGARDPRLKDYYARRQGEQAMGGHPMRGGRSPGGNANASPTRRPVAGRPVRRRLPGW